MRPLAGRRQERAGRGLDQVRGARRKHLQTQTGGERDGRTGREGGSHRQGRGCRREGLASKSRAAEGRPAHARRMPLSGEQGPGIL